MSTLLVTFLALAAIATQPRPGPAALTVSAAVSLADALEDIARAYSTAGGGAVRFNFAGSNVLSRQIAAGAPVDVFVSADEAQMAIAEAAGAIDRASRVALVGNRLAVVTRRGAAPLTDLRALATPAFKRIAIGDPAAVPAGVYARQYLLASGLWTAIEPKLVPVGNVRAALAAAASGSVDAAFVYQTDAAISHEVDLALVVSGPDAPRIVYPVAITSGTARRAAAEQFVRFVAGPEAGAIFARYGFTPLAGTR